MFFQLLKWMGRHRGMVARCQTGQAGSSSVALGFLSGHLLLGTTRWCEWQHVSAMIPVAASDEISGWRVMFIPLLPSFLHISSVPFLTFLTLIINSFPPFPPPYTSHHLSLSLSPDSREESVLGSIPLPSYIISSVGPEDHISRKYAFKVRLFLFHILLCCLVFFEVLSLMLCHWFGVVLNYICKKKNTNTREDSFWNK